MARIRIFLYEPLFYILPDRLPFRSTPAAEMIREIMAYLKDEGLEITFRMHSGYFDENILKTIESFGCTYVIKGKEYPTLVAQVTDPAIVLLLVKKGGKPPSLPQP